MAEMKKQNRFAASVSSLRDENSITKAGKTDPESEKINSEIQTENQIKENETRDLSDFNDFNMSSIIDTISVNHPKGKPETFYLSNEVSKEIEKVSKQKKSVKAS